MASSQPEPTELPRLGSVFGHYRLDALVGRGGMGVVFRATDLRLERTVALKFLMPSLADDIAFRERFVRESRLAAAIEHPSIVPIYEAGTIGSSLYIAMRFVPGRDLGSILRLEAPLELARTVTLASRIADALDAAHRRGLVHRDVKPANVLVEADGEERACLADFGLTRRLGEASASTRSGLVGTIDYIAPEQIQAGTVDGRADQYALACLVVHCLTGSVPFERDSDAAVLYAHVHAEPPSVRAIRPDLPDSIEVAIGRAMSKSPGDRFPDCRAFVTALDAPSGIDLATSSAAPPRPDPLADGRPRRLDRRRGVSAALVGIVAVVPLVVGTLIVALPIVPGDLGAGSAGSPSVAAVGAVTDLWPGELVVFASDVDGDWDLYALDAGQAQPRQLTNTSRHERSPAISPDGRTIAYVVGSDPERDIWLMDADGGDRRPLVTHAADDIDPAWSSDGRSLAFASERRGPSDYDIFEIRDRGAGLSQSNARNLTARVAIESYPNWRPGSRQVAISSNYYGNNREIVIIDADDASSQRRVTNVFAYDSSPVHAPDGRAIAFVRRPYVVTAPGNRGAADIFMVDTRSGDERRLTSTPLRQELDPDWSPDGRALVYAAGPTDATEIWVMAADGRRRRQLTDGWANAVEPAWGRRPETTSQTDAP